MYKTYVFITNLYFVAETLKTERLVNFARIRYDSNFKFLLSLHRLSRIKNGSNTDGRILNRPFILSVNIPFYLVVNLMQLPQTELRWPNTFCRPINNLKLALTIPNLIYLCIVSDQLSTNIINNVLQRLFYFFRNYDERTDSHFPSVAKKLLWIY